MVQIAGKYQHVKNENFEEYLKTIGVPEDKAKAGALVKPTLEILVDGKKITTISVGTETLTSTFILDTEVDEALPTTSAVLKSTATLKGDTLSIISKLPGGISGTRVYKFSDTEVVLTLTTSPSGVTAKRFYKRV